MSEYSLTMLADVPRATPLPPSERRLALIRASEPLLLQYGAALTTRQIAEAAEVAEGTLFRVFDSKDELIEATVASLLDPQRTVDELAAIDAEADLHARLVAAATVLQQRMERFMALFGVLAPRHDRHKPTAEFLAQRRRENELLLDALVLVIEPDQYQLRVGAMEVARLLQALSVSARHPVISPDLEHRDPAQLVDLLLYGVQLDLDGPPPPLRNSTPPAASFDLLPDSLAIPTGGTR